MLRVIEVKNKKDKKRFLQFQYDLYRSDKHFVPPLKSDRKKLLDTKRNPFFRNNRLALFICEKNNIVVGRVAAIENKRHNEFHNEKVGFFGFFEAINESSVSSLLFDAVEQWHKKIGYTHLVGPVNPHINDDSPGILIKGLDDDPVMLLAYSKKYYPFLLETYGFKKEKDLYSYWVSSKGVGNEEKIKRINEKIMKRHNLSIRPINMKNFQNEYLIIQGIFNKAWEKNWGQIPLTKEDFEYIASDLKSAVHPDFIILSFKENKPIGIAVSFPDLNELIKPMRGKLLTPKAIPFFNYLITKKITCKRLRVIILGVLPEYDHTGATSLLYQSIIDGARKHNMTGAEISWILEDNEKMNKAAVMLGGKHTKTFRIYGKEIVPKDE